jgi:hypothetical protein
MFGLKWRGGGILEIKWEKGKKKKRKENKQTNVKEISLSYYIV